uniref:Protein kinase domain-containing protein n=1 Tax=Caenorhabditis japonica TaxID=281687 RepID=A0A8R1HZR3_CAEJA
MPSSDRYETLQVAGRGAFGLVVIARDNFVLKYLDCFATADILSIVTEEVPYTLADVIKDTLKPKGENLNRWFYTQILSGIAYIHSKDIMHRDMKPENILITLRNIVKIADFGQACIYRKEVPDEEYELDVGTRWYRAPELLFGSQKYKPSVDVWAIGCILAEMGRSELEQISIIFGVLGTPSSENWPAWKTMPDAQKLLFFPKEPTNDWADLLRCKEISAEFENFILLHLQYGSRPAASVLLMHSWIRKGTLVEPKYRISRRNTERKRDALPPIHPFFF